MIPAVRNLIIGGGVIGLAAASKLSKFGTTLLVEKNSRLGAETSSHNSEVIHSGIYYPPSSLKTKTCIKGRQMMYDVCERYHIPYRKIGKWIFATRPEEVQKLIEIQNIARETNNILNFVPKHKLEEEKGIKVVEALESPETGIVDSHQFLLYLQQSVESNGGQIALRTEVVDVEKHPSRVGYKVTVKEADQSLFSFTAYNIVNASGLWSDKVARLIMKEKFPSSYKIHLCKGHYFSYHGTPLMKVPKLLYPIPEPGLVGLGIHATFDMAGNVRFGPDTKYIDEIDYSFDENELPTLKNKFFHVIKSYIPSIKEEKLHPDYTGIRPKLSAPTENQFKDFIIKHETEFEGLINLIGIESPGLTASLAIAEEVALLLGHKQ